jgi:hypothetical protein
MPLTAEELAELTKTIGESLTTSIQESVVGATGKLVNDAITKRLSAFEKTMGSTLESTITKSLEGLKPATQTVHEGGAQDPAKDPSTVALRTMEAKLADVVARAEAADKRANAERMKNREAALHATATDSLSKLGIVDPIALKLAVGHLKSEKRLQFEDDDNDDAPVLYRADDNSMLGLGEGLKKWMTTPEAKHFMPPTGTRGSGSRPTGSSGGTAPTKEAAESLLWEKFGEAIRNQ